MENITLYMHWLQLFMNSTSVVLCFIVGKNLPSFRKQWYTLGTALSLALVYRLIQLAQMFPQLAWFQENKNIINYMGATFFLPVTALLIMIFMIQMYRKLV